MFVVPGGLHKGADFGDGVCQRFFAVNVLSPLYGGHGCYGVCMIGGAHNNGIYFVFHLVEHLAKIAIHFGLGILLNRGGTTQINVTEGDDIVTVGHGVDVTAAHAAGAYTGYV